MQGLLKTNLIGLGGKCLYDVVVRYQARNVLSGNNTLLATYCSILCMGCTHHTIRMYQYCVAGKKKCIFFICFFTTYLCSGLLASLQVYKKNQVREGKINSQIIFPPKKEVLEHVTSRSLSTAHQAPGTTLPSGSHKARHRRWW